MEFYKIEEFLEEILSHVKFVLDRYEIKLELKDHMIDKLEYYIESGYDEEQAERLTIEDMGNPKEIGVELNKQHNPIIGWIWRISNRAIVIFVIINIIMVGVVSFSSLFITNYVKRIPKDNIAYIIDLDEKVQIDNRVIKFTNVIYEKDGKMNIIYKIYQKKFLGRDWDFGSIGSIKDEKGNIYRSGSGSGGGGLIASWIKIIDDFPADAKTLIIDYDEYNRKYTIEIPLKTGENNE